VRSGQTWSRVSVVYGHLKQPWRTLAGLFWQA